MEEPKNNIQTQGSIPELKQVSFQPYSSPTPGEIPVMAIFSNGDFDDGTLYPLTLARTKSMGLNFVQRSISTDNNVEPVGQEDMTKEERIIAKLLDEAKTIGLRVMVRPGGSSHFLFQNEDNYKLQLNSWKRIVGYFYNHEAVAGWQLCDEPNEVEYNPKYPNNIPIPFDHIVPRLREVQQAITALDPWNHPVYVNLGTYRGFVEEIAPNVYEPIFQEGFKWVKGYNKYVRTFLNGFGPAVLSASCYPATNVTAPSVRMGAVEDLEIYKRLSYSTRHPYWGYVLCAFTPALITYKVGEKTEYVVDPVTGLAKTEQFESYIEKMKAMYRMQVYCNLAFGAQGICWWSIVSSKEDLKKNNDGDVVAYTYLWAPIDQNGNINEELCNEIKDINNEIKSVQDIFLNATVLETKFSIFHTYFKSFFPPTNNRDTPNTEYPLGPLLNIPKKSHTTGYGFLMSLLNNRDRTYVVFVNMDLKEANQTAELTFSKRMKRLPIGGAVSEIINPYSKYTLTCKKGGWAIFVVE